MRISPLSSFLCLALSLSCASGPLTSNDSSSANSRTSDGMGTITTSPTPNINYEAGDISKTTDVDPEGDIAPIVTCKDGEIERRQSGKVVCVSPAKDPSGSTMGGR
jgi:hypothetical protein